MLSPASVFALSPRWLLVLCCAWAMVACSPVFNWRELRPEGTPLQALMPCKPDSAERAVPLAGASTVLHMQSCKTGGLTFALAWAELPDAGLVPTAMADWQRASLAAVRVDPARHTDPALLWDTHLAGSSLVQGLAVQGTDAQGQPVATRVLYFARGAQVFQAAMYGPAIDEEAGTAFFDGLKLP